MTDNAYKISPSDFAYLYKECKRCYYTKVKHNLKRPSTPMPGVFSTLNSLLQRSLVGNNLNTLSKELPEGIVESQEGLVTSKIIEQTNIFINGKYDLLVKQPDGTYLVVDFKISEPNEEKIEKYQYQLLAYQYAFSNPKNDLPKQITKLGLIIMYPSEVNFSNGRAFVNFPPKWLEVPYNKESYEGFIKLTREINDLINGPTPDPNPNCAYCSYVKEMGVLYN